MSDKNKDLKSKVLEFPKEKSKRIEMKRRRMPFDQKHLVTSAATLTIMILAALTHNGFQKSQHQHVDTFALNSHSSVASGRMIASIPETANRSLASVSWENQLADRLAESQAREVASIGAKPTAEERLRFGDLEGKYQVVFNAGKISEIQFSSGASSTQPKYVDSRAEFLLRNKKLLPVDFSQVQKAESKRNDDKDIVETYELSDSNQNKVAQVQFQLDLYGRMISMKVEKSKSAAN